MILVQKEIRLKDRVEKKKKTKNIKKMISQKLIVSKGLGAYQSINNNKIFLNYTYIIDRRHDFLLLLLLF
jgi:hypothetical protein